MLQPISPEEIEQRPTGRPRLFSPRLVRKLVISSAIATLIATALSFITVLFGDNLLGKKASSDVPVTTTADPPVLDYRLASPSTSGLPPIATSPNPPAPLVEEPPAEPATTPTVSGLALTGTPEVNRRLIISSLVGRWSGELRCNDQEFQFSLHITEASQDLVRAALTYYVINASVPNVLMEMGGRYDALTDRLELNHGNSKVDTIYPWVDLKGTYTYRNARILTGLAYIDGESCGRWSLRPGDEAARETGPHEAPTGRGRARITFGRAS